MKEIEIKRIKEEFPIFKYHPQLVYLDSASTTQTPQVVLDAMGFFYEQRRANIHRGTYQLSGLTTQLYEESRHTVAEFINADATEVVFTSGTTHGLNTLTYGLCKNLQSGDNIVLTRMEHHANLVPWLEMSKRYGFELRFIELYVPSADRQSPTAYMLDITSAEKLVDTHTKIISFCHTSNTLGTVNPVKKLIALAKQAGAISIVDAAQSVAHTRLDVKELDCDFLVFSGHKIYGPTGIGVLYGKKERLAELDPFFFGGDMIREVRYNSATWNDLPWKFEGGTPNIAGALGLAEAIRFVGNLGLEEFHAHEQALRALTIHKLNDLDRITIIGPKDSAAGPIVSFTVDGVHPHDVAQILDHHGIAVRAGHHCTMPLMDYLGLTGTIRASYGIYNSQTDIDQLMTGLYDVVRRF